MTETLKGLFGAEAVTPVHSRVQSALFTRYFEEFGEYEEALHFATEEAQLAKLVHKPLKVLTPFQIVKWFFGLKRFEIGFTELVGGLFIFDEIHAYDAHTAGLIMESIKLIRDMGGRFLIMSATIPDFLFDKLTKYLDHDVTHIELDPTDKEENRLLTKPRHRIFLHDAKLEDMVEPIKKYARQRKVLVIANRVGQAQNLYRKLAGPGVYLLHSRFSHGDRNQKERKILQILRKQSAEALQILIATQVIEVSLDVSFEVLFTEVAPTDDLLQRMGRVNRYGEMEKPAEVHICLSYDADKVSAIYPQRLIQSTISAAPPSGDTVNFLQAATWLKDTYREGWPDKEENAFQEAATLCQNLVKNHLRPLRRGVEDEFFDLFQTFEVLPSARLAEYESLSAEGKLLQADNLLVPIRSGLWHKLRRDGLTNRRTDGVDVVWVKYTSDLGLVPEEPDEPGTRIL